MSQFSREEIDQQISQIVSQFSLLACDQCAKAVVAWLEIHGIEYKILRLRTKYPDEDFITSERLERLGIPESVTVNGRHYGVEIQGWVFDNLSKDGLLREEWLQDFHCPSEEFVLEELTQLDQFGESRS